MAHAGTLAIRGLNKQYEVKGEALPVLQDINLTIEPGEFVSIVGSSGCGKSTLLRLVIGLEGDYQGEILLNGQRIVGTSLNRGIVFQEHRLFPWLTVEKNVALGLLNSSLTEGQQRATVREHIALVGLQGFETAYPHQLSGGMQSRAALARALVQSPDALLLDEPFAALDIGLKAHMHRLLQTQRVQRSLAVLMITHDVAEAVTLADTVLVMAAHPGRIVWRLDLAQPPEQRGDAWVLRQTAALLAQAPVRAAFDLPASADGDAEDVCDALDGLNGRGLAAGQALAPHAAPRHGC